MKILVCVVRPGQIIVATCYQYVGELSNLEVTDQTLDVPRLLGRSCLLQHNLLLLPHLLDNVVAPQMLHFSRALVVLVVVTDVPETVVSLQLGQPPLKYLLLDAGHSLSKNM